jgi:hypothetical protein
MARARAQAEARREFLREHNIPTRDPRCPPGAIDLTDYYNAGLKEKWHAYSKQNNLSELPRGLQSFAGVPFDVRGLIQLGSERPQSQRFPEAVKKIKAAVPGRRFHFLHAVSERPQRFYGEQVGSYIIRFANQQTWEIPIIYGRDLRDWWTEHGEPFAPTAAVVAWQGSNPVAAAQGKSIRLFMSTWDSPMPRAQVESIDFVSTMSGPAPFLVAITLEP